MTDHTTFVIIVIVVVVLLLWYFSQNSSKVNYNYPVQETERFDFIDNSGNQ